jgi:hypothetical protein
MDSDQRAEDISILLPIGNMDPPVEKRERAINSEPGGSNISTCIPDERNTSEGNKIGTIIPERSPDKKRPKTNNDTIMDEEDQESSGGMLDAEKSSVPSDISTPALVNSVVGNEGQLVERDNRDVITGPGSHMRYGRHGG